MARQLTPFFAKSAVGALIYDVEGRELIDFSGGIGVMNVGHSHPKVVAAIKDQAEKFTHTCFRWSCTKDMCGLLKSFANWSPGEFSKMAVFANSGAEAVENAVKVARHFTKRHSIIALYQRFSWQDLPYDDAHQ